MNKDDGLFAFDFKTIRVLCLIGCVIVTCMFIISQYLNKSGSASDLRKVNGISKEMDANDIVIVVDAGHGGYDPGKVGVDGQLEKNINLIISKFLGEELKKSGVTVIQTRMSDVALCGDENNSKKTSDLKARIKIMEDNNSTLAVSIHQNSFSSGNVKGAQVFYYENSEKGKILADTIQDKLKELDETNNRVAKSNSSYYLLKKSNLPIVIVECGFLSNEQEARKLQSEDYQKEIARKIAEGIIMYLNENM